MGDRGSGSDQTVLVGARIYRRVKQSLDVEGNSSEGSEGDAKLGAGETGDRPTYTSNAASRPKRPSLLPGPLEAAHSSPSQPHN